MHDPEVAADASEAGRIYGATAAQYIEHIGSELSVAVDGAAELSALDDFAASIPTGTVADVGCGPGRAAAYLAARGLDVVGFDIAPGMVAAARTTHPSIPFEVGTLTAIPAVDDAFAGAVCWYSIIHTPLAELEPAWVELRRVLQPSAPLLLAFQAGEGERVERPKAVGTERTLVNHRHDPHNIAEALARAGFTVESVEERAAAAEHENSPQAMVLARVSQISANHTTERSV